MSEIRKTDVRDSLRVFIRGHGYKQTAIAKKANMTPDALSACLNKKRQLEANEFLDVCAAMQIQPGDLQEYERSSA